MNRLRCAARSCVWRRSRDAARRSRSRRLSAALSTAKSTRSAWSRWRAVAAASGPVEIAIADTIGVAGPAQAARPGARRGCGDQALAGARAFSQYAQHRPCQCVGRREAGAATVDASLGRHRRLSVCAVATGNVPTEDVVYLLERSGYRTGLVLDRLIESAQWLGTAMGREVPGMLSRAGAFPGRAPARRAASAAACEWRRPNGWFPRSRSVSPRWTAPSARIHRVCPGAAGRVPACRATPAPPSASPPASGS